MSGKQRLYYPRINRVGVDPEWELRTLTIIDRVDLVAHPLPIADYLRRPLVRRGRWLLRAYDHDLGEYRQFYECAFKHCFREPVLRIGIREDCKIRFIDRPYLPTVPDRREMAVTLANLARSTRFPSVRVFADDLFLLTESDDTSSRSKAS